MSGWNVTEVDGMLEQAEEETSLLVIDNGKNRPEGLDYVESILSDKNYIDLNLGNIQDHPEERFGEDEIKAQGDGFYIVDPGTSYESVEEVVMEPEGNSDKSEYGESRQDETGTPLEPEDDPVEQTNDTSFNQNPTTNTKGGDNIMADGLLDEIYERADSHVADGKDEYDALETALEEVHDLNKYSDEKIQAVETGLRELSSDVDDLYNELEVKAAEARGKREAIEDDLEDRRDSIEASANEILGGRY